MLLFTVINIGFYLQVDSLIQRYERFKRQYEKHLIYPWLKESVKTIQKKGIDQSMINRNFLHSFPGRHTEGEYRCKNKEDHFPIINMINPSEYLSRLSNYESTSVLHLEIESLRS